MGSSEGAVNPRSRVDCLLSAVATTLWWTHPDSVATTMSIRGLLGEGVLQEIEQEDQLEQRVETEAPEEVEEGMEQRDQLERELDMGAPREVKEKRLAGLRDHRLRRLAGDRHTHLRAFYQLAEFLRDHPLLHLAGEFQTRLRALYQLHADAGY